MALIAIPVFPPESQSVPMLACSVCRENPIPRPPGATPATRFTCKRCCDTLWRQKLKQARLRVAKAPIRIQF
jgi:hypothetical protein